MEGKADLSWRKASYSGNGGADCVEVNVSWRKASYSGNGGGDCVEVGDHGRRVLVRDTKDRSGPMLGFTLDEWREFASQIKRS
jgi:hypothetical protein